MNKVGIVVLIAGITLASCSDFGSDPPPLLVSNDIRESVIRFMIQNPPSGASGNIFAYYVSFSEIEGINPFINVQDPPDKFLERFRDLSLPVKRGSQVTRLPYPLVDVQTGEPGMWLYVSRIEVLDQNTVRVSAGDAYCLNRYWLVREGRRWTVTRWGTTWIS